MFEQPINVADPTDIVDHTLTKVGISKSGDKKLAV
jgi:hypothetical protein